MKKAGFLVAAAALTGALAIYGASVSFAAAPPPTQQSSTTQVTSSPAPNLVPSNSSATSLDTAGVDSGPNVQQGLQQGGTSGAPDGTELNNKQPESDGAALGSSTDSGPNVQQGLQQGGTSGAPDGTEAHTGTEAGN